MPTGWSAGLKRFILWDYPRACWQYDVMVGLILAFLFLTPREWFRDQPNPKSVVLLPAEQGASVFWIEPELLLGVPEAQWPGRAMELLKSQSAGKKRSFVRLVPIFDAEKVTRGYMVFTNP